MFYGHKQKENKSINVQKIRSVIQTMWKIYLQHINPESFSVVKFMSSVALPSLASQPFLWRKTVGN